MTSRVAAIVIDAAEWWYLERLIDEGRLPNIARLRARAVEAPIETPVEFRSEVVWARFLTGREPLEDREWPVCVTFDPETYTCGTNTATTQQPFFAFDDGTKVVALDLIHSSPSDAVDGIQVIGWGSHSPQWPRQSLPQGLITEVDRRFGTNPAMGNDFDYGWHLPDFAGALETACKVGVDRRVDVAEWLLTERLPDWDLFVTCISEFHSVGHQFWHGVDESHPLHGVAPTTDIAAQTIANVTEAVDAAVGRLLDIVGDDTNVVLCAFHGFQPADDLVGTVLLPELVQRLHTGSGLLLDPDQTSWRKAGCPPIIPEDGEQIGEYFVDRFADSPKQRLRRALRMHLPRAAFGVVRRLAGKQPLTPLSAMDKPVGPEVIDLTDEVLAAFEKAPEYQIPYWYRRHWAEMPWFVLPSFADGHVRLNVRGREAAGSVAPEDYEATLGEVEAFLREITDVRTGRSIIKEIVRVRADEPMAVDGPDCDLLLIFEGAPDAIHHPEVGTVGPHPHLRTSHHSANGFALVAGPGIEHVKLDARPASDITPTVLALLGKDTSGTVGEPLLDVPVVQRMEQAKQKAAS